MARTSLTAPPRSVHAFRPASAGGEWGDVKVFGKASASASSAVQTVVKAQSVSANQWRHQKLESIAAALAAPYGVKVITEVDTGARAVDHILKMGDERQ